mgnify:CR=1 FL=1
MPTATADDVRLDGNGGVIAVADPSEPGVDYGLTDADIDGYIDDAAFEAAQANSDYSEWSTERQRQLEKYLAALKIRENVDKPISSTSRETASVSYESMTLPALKREVNKRDPSGQLAYLKDTNRYTGSTNR